MPDTTLTTETSGSFLDEAIASVAEQASAQAPETVEPPPPPPPSGPPKLTLQVSEGSTEGRSGYLSFNDVDGEGWADPYPEACRPSPAGTLSLSGTRHLDDSLHSQCIRTSN